MKWRRWWPCKWQWWMPTEIWWKKSKACWLWRLWIQISSVWYGIGKKSNFNLHFDNSKKIWIYFQQIIEKVERVEAGKYVFRRAFNTVGEYRCAVLVMFPIFFIQYHWLLLIFLFQLFTFTLISLTMLPCKTALLSSLSHPRVFSLLFWAKRNVK